MKHGVVAVDATRSAVFYGIEKNGEIFLSGDNVQYDSRPYCVLGSTRRIRADRPSYVGIAATIRVAIAKSPG